MNNNQKYVGIFDDFKKKVVDVRSTIEKFKDDHKMANQAISVIISSLPSPFDKFGQVMWDGIEAKDIGPNEMLQVLERIEKNDELSFMRITSSIATLFEKNATKEDISKIAEEVRTSNQSVVILLESKLEEINRNVLESKNEMLKKFDEVSAQINQLSQRLGITTVIVHGQQIQITNESKREFESLIQENENLQLQLLKQNQELPPLDIDTELKQGNFYFYSNNYEKAIEHYDRVLKVYPGNTDALYNKGLLFRSISKNREAIECFNKAILINPNDVRFWYQKVGPLISLGKTKKAIECYEKAIKINPNADWNGRGVALMRLGGLERAKEAIKCFEKAIEIDHVDNYAWRNKGEAFKILGKTKKAIECYEKAIAINSHDFRSWYYKGSLLFNSNNLKGAIACWNAVLKLKPDHVDASYSKGVALDLLKKGRL